jgi:hypothetical protein
MPPLPASSDSTATRSRGRDYASPTGPLAGPDRAKMTSPAARGTQRLQALQRANEVRLVRAEVKNLIAAGKMSVIEAIDRGSWAIQKMAVIELLLSQRSWGYARCRGLLRAIPLSEAKTVGAMTVRQRGLLAALLAEQAPRSPIAPA